MNKTIAPEIHFQPYINAEGMEEVRYIDPSFPVELWSANFENLAHNRLATHWHEAFEIALIVSGKAIYHFGPEYVTLSSGEALFINSAVPHDTTPFDKDLEMFTIAFPPRIFGLPGYKLYEETVAPILQSKNGASILTDPKIPQKLEEIYSDAQSPELSFMRMSLQILELWGLLMNYFRQNSSDQYAIRRLHSREEMHLKQCIAFIRKNWRETISIEDIANSASISKNTCYRLFKQYLQLTPMTYINQFRVSQAELMLLETNQPVIDIALSCGFNSVVYFDRVFKQIHGKTPLEYRHSER